MGLEQFRRPDRHKQFADAVTERSVDYDNIDSRANTYAVGDSCRVWYHHASEEFAGVSKKTRKDLVSADDRRLIHLFVLEERDAFKEFVAGHKDELAATATRIDWFALPDDSLEQYSTAGSEKKFNINEGDFRKMTPYRHDARNMLG